MLYFALSPEKIAVRQDIAKRDLVPLLDTLEDFLQKNGVEGCPYAIGERLSIADIYIYVFMSDYKSGWLDGIPTDLVLIFISCLQILINSNELLV